MEYSPRILEAMALMYALHARQQRKGGGIPYITHLLAVASLVGEHGGDEDQFIAALLHDAVEDQGGLETLGQIQDQFGLRVAGYVQACTDTHVQPKPPWRERKEAHLADMAQAPPEVKLILASDKLHNARTILANLATDGEAFWDRFNGGKAGSLWYYTASLQALGTDWQHPLLHELAQTVRRIQHLAEPESATPA